MENKVANKFGVKVGDYFYSSWGYEQTNVNWFQVVALAGQSSVRIREVNPPVIAVDGIGPMSEDCTYELDSSNILPPASRSSWIKDQEKGDLKRLRSYAADGVSNPSVYMTSYADAYLCTESKKKLYNSWYA